MSGLLDRFPNADLLKLTEEQRLFAVEGFVAIDVYNRVNLDIGKTIQDKAPTPRTALSRLKDIKDYIKQTVSACFRAAAKTGERLAARGISELAQRTIRETFEVFEDYIQ